MTRNKGRTGLSKKQLKSASNSDRNVNRAVARMRADLMLAFASVLSHRKLLKKELAKILKERPSTVSAIMAMTANPTLATLAEWQHRLGVEFLFMNASPYHVTFQRILKQTRSASMRDLPALTPVNLNEPIEQPVISEKSNKHRLDKTLSTHGVDFLTFNSKSATVKFSGWQASPMELRSNNVLQCPEHEHVSHGVS